MPDQLSNLVNDPEFAALPPERQRLLAGRMDGALAGLAPDRQDKVLAAMRMDGAPQAPATSERGAGRSFGENAPSTSTTTTPTIPTGPPDDLIGHLYYRTLGRAEAYGQALGYKAGLTTESPQQLAAEPGRDVPNVPVPQGKLATAGALLETATPALATIPGGPLLRSAPVLQGALWGAGLAAAHATGSETAGDIVEGILGGGLFVKDLAKVGAAGVRQFQRGRGVMSEAVRGFFDARREAKVAAALATAKQREAAAARALDTVAETRVRAADTAHQQALRDAIENPPAHMPRGLVRAAVGQPATEAAPGMMAAGPLGERLQAVGENASELAPPGAKKIGVVSQTRDTRKVRREAYREAVTLADSPQEKLTPDDPLHPVMLPLPSGAAAALQETAFDYHKVLTGSGGTVTERKLALQLANLAGDVVDAPDGTLIVKGPFGEVFDATQAQAAATGGVPYSKLLNLHAVMANVGLNPREYATSSGRGQLAFVALKDALDKTLRDLELSRPELYVAARRARGIVRDVEKPLQQTARAALGRATTPVEAARDLFFPGILKDPTHAKRVLIQESTPGRERYIEGLWDQFLEHMTDHNTGAIDLTKMRKTWSQTHPEVRMLLSAGSNPNAAADLSALLTRHEQLGGLAARSQAEVERAAKALKLESANLREARDTMTKAIDISTHAGEQAVLKSQHAELLRTRQPPRQNSLRGGLWTSMAIAQLAYGHFVPFGLFHAFMGYSYLKRPLTVAESLRTPLETFEGRRLASALAATAKGWRGYEVRQGAQP